MTLLGEPGWRSWEEGAWGGGGRRNDEEDGEDGSPGWVLRGRSSVGCAACSERGWGTPGSSGSPAECWALVLLAKVAQLPLSLKDKAWHHVCVAWTTRDGKWSAYQDGEQRAAGENLASWHAIKPQGIIILGQEQVRAGPTPRAAGSHHSGVKPAGGAAPGWGKGKGLSCPLVRTVGGPRELTVFSSLSPSLCPPFSPLFVFLRVSHTSIPSLPCLWTSCSASTQTSPSAPRPVCPLDACPFSHPHPCPTTAPTLSQDTLGGRFDATQAFVGELAQFGVWDHMLAPAEILGLANCTSHLQGNVIQWDDQAVEVFGGAGKAGFTACEEGRKA